MKTPALHIICFSLLLGVLFLPFVQERTGLVPERPLFGVEALKDSVPFTQAAWFNGEYQKNFAERHYKWMGMRPAMVRLHNQLDFWLFDQTFGSVMVGKEQELFSRGSLEAIKGKDFVGWEEVRYHARNTSVFQGHFSSKGVKLLTVITPNKLQCMPGYLPEGDLPPSENSNYSAYIKELRGKGVNLIDLTAPLKGWVASEPHRIFPRTGTHWTDYGAFLAADSIIRAMELMSGRAYIHPRVTAFENSTDMRGTDANSGDILNLVFDIAPAEVHYPRLAFDSTGKVRPRVLVVGDSFWWKIYDQGIHREVFAPGSQYRYYNFEVFSDQWTGARNIADFDLKQIMENLDFVVLCVNTDNLHRYPFDFIDQVLRLY